jgi:hypothetical protein
VNRIHLYILNGVALLLAALILTNLWLVTRSQSMALLLAQTQAAVGNSRRAEQILTQLSMRIARESDKDPALLELLKKHNLKVTLEVDGKTKAYP